MIIAIDYDNTITVKDSYPNIGVIDPKAIDVINKLKDRGHTLCLWTCRSYETGTLQEALEALKKAGIEFDYINESPYNTGSPKIVADIYIDDRAFGGIVDWNIIEKYLCKEKKDD